jgi:glycyl-tRNA synthetase
MSCDQLLDALRLYNITAPDTGNAVSDPFPFNLMFQTQIGPTGKLLGCVERETSS